MNFELFIAQRLRKSKLESNNYSGPISNICIIAICISVVIMIITTSSGLGLKNTITQKIRTIQSDIIISNIIEDGTKIQISKDLLNNINNLKNIKTVYPIINKMAIISNNENTQDIVLKGVPTNYKPKLLEEIIVDGSMFKNQNEIIISSYQANSLKLKLGDQCIMYFVSNKNNIQKRKFTISGIYKSESDMYNKTFAFININQLQKINKWTNKYVTNYEISIHNYNDRFETSDNINNIISYNMIAQSVDKKFASIFNWIKLFDKNIIFILLIMLLICIINITNTLLILILEKIKMIGVLKSFGCSNYSILKIFLYRNGLINLKGIILGNFLGISVCLIQYFFHIIKLNPQSYFINYMPIYFDLKIIIMISIITFLVTHITIIIPYYIIKQISPNQLLKIK